jgi:hypothetical protein
MTSADDLSLVILIFATTPEGDAYFPILVQSGLLEISKRFEDFSPRLFA